MSSYEILALVVVCAVLLGLHLLFEIIFLVYGKKIQDDLEKDISAAKEDPFKDDSKYYEYNVWEDLSPAPVCTQCGDDYEYTYRDSLCYCCWANRELKLDLEGEGYENPLADVGDEEFDPMYHPKKKRWGIMRKNCRDRKYRSWKNHRRTQYKGK